MSLLRIRARIFYFLVARIGSIFHKCRELVALPLWNGRRWLVWVGLKERSKTALYNYFDYIVMEYSGNITSILKYIYSDTTFNGWVQRWGWDDTGSKLSVLRGSDRVTDLTEQSSGRNDVYITKNIMKRPDKRGTSQVFAFNAIVIDCDLHSDGLTVQQINTACDVLRGVLMDRSEVLPSVFVRTGRGVQLWYLIKPVAVAMSWLYEIVQDKLFDMVGALIEGEGLPFELDKSVKDAGRVVRLPGSWNYKVQRFGSWEIMAERYSLQELVEDLGGVPVRKKEKIVYKYKSAGDYTGLCWKQKQTIEKLCSTRSSMQGMRNTALYLYGAAVFQVMDKESAINACEELNKCKSMGLKNNEVENVINFYLRHGVEKHCKVETFFSLLGMSAEEIAEYRNAGAKEAERQAARDRKAARNNLIEKYYIQGFTVSQIAEAVGVARGTVYAVLAKVKVQEVVEEVGKNGLRIAAAFARMLSEDAAERWDIVSETVKKSFVPVVGAPDPGGGLALSG